MDRTKEAGSLTSMVRFSASLRNSNGSNGHSFEGEERERERDSLLIMRYKCTSARELLCSLQPYMIQLKIVENIKPAS